MHMVDSKYSLKLKNNHKPENKCIDAKKCQFLFVMQYWRMNCGTLWQYNTMLDAQKLSLKHNWLRTGDWCILGKLTLKLCWCKVGNYHYMNHE